MPLPILTGEPPGLSPPGESGESGGPRVICGHGGSKTILGVVPPSPSGIGTAIGGMLRLVEGVSSPLVVVELQSIFENDMSVTVMGATVIVTIIVLVKNVVITWPCASLVVP